MGTMPGTASTIPRGPVDRVVTTPKNKDPAALDLSVAQMCAPPPAQALTQPHPEQEPQQPIVQQLQQRPRHAPHRLEIFVMTQHSNLLEYTQRLVAMVLRVQILTALAGPVCALDQIWVSMQHVEQ